jgi:transposase
MSRSPEQKIMEPEAKVKLLEKPKSFLERQAFIADKKEIIFNMMIDIAEEEYKIDIRKNSPPEQSTILNKKQ